MTLPPSSVEGLPAPDAGRAVPLLRGALAEASTIKRAGQAVVDLLLDWGADLPSLYLERGDRLRCVAQHGYWYVFDGVPAGEGVLGTVWGTGEAVALFDVAGAQNYIAAIPQVLAEICVPVCCEGRSVGIVNAEFTRRPAPGWLPLLEQVAAVFADRVTELAGPTIESRAERLARYGVELAKLSGTDTIAAACLEAGVELAGVSTAVLVVLGEDGDLVPEYGRGPLYEAVATLPPQTLHTLARGVARATSSYTKGKMHGPGFESAQMLEERGIDALFIHALGTGHDRLGFLALADSSQHPFPEEIVPLLELLAAMTAAALRTAEATAALKASEQRLAHLARHDQLTGLPNRGALHELLVEGVTRSRATGHALGLLFVDLDGFKGVNDRVGHGGGDRLLVLAADRLLSMCRTEDAVLRLGGDEFVMICPGLPDLDAVTQIADRVVDRLQQPYQLADRRIWASASVGVALAGPDDDPEGALAAADAAMYRAKAAGRGRWAAAGPPDAGAEGRILPA